MEVKIHSATYVKGIWSRVPIFSYSSNGIPGIEIVGLGVHGKIIKEKLTYILRSSDFKLPMKRYLLCVEHRWGRGELDFNASKWFEFPLLICLLQLSKYVNIFNIENCMACGYVSSSKVIFVHYPPHSLCSENILIGGNDSLEGHKVLDLSMLLKQVGNFKLIGSSQAQ